MTSPENLWFLDTLVRVLVPREAGADGLSILESVARRGDSPPLHVHRTEDEAFHVLEGQLTIRVAGRDVKAGAGESLLAPKGIPHTYRVDSDRARWLVVTAHGDFESFVRGFSRPAERLELPEYGGPPSPDAQDRLARAAAEHGIDLVGPPLS